MGKFSEQFKLSKRIRQADFGRKETREYWIAWANGVIDRVSPKKEGYRDVNDVAISDFSKPLTSKMEADLEDFVFEQSSRVDKFEVTEEDQVLEKGSFEEVVNDTD